MASSVLLGCRSIAKTFGERPLFERLTFTIDEGDRVGLVGPNGSGKSTLLKILAGADEPDSGECSRRKGLSVGFVPQHPRFDDGLTALDVLRAALGAVPHLDAHERDARAVIALRRSGFDDPDIATRTLSGGWRTRLAIASALAVEPDLLLLDEPTNHLDLESILALEEALEATASAFVVVSHDRTFLERVARRMIEIDRVYPEGLLAVAGAYTELLLARQATLTAQAAYEESLANRVRREVAWLSRGPKARTTKSRSRIDAAERSIEELRGSRERGGGEAVRLDLVASGRKTRLLWACEGLTKRYGDRTIIEGLDLTLTAGTRLGLLGANGAGKTTLLEMIAARALPDAGAIRRAEGLRVVYLDQARESIDPALTLERALAPEGEQVIYRGEPVHVVTWARRFLFRREQLALPVARLSGGERARIVLARTMLRPADLLVLDEPTNDLDIATLEVLEESLVDFPGALVLVTHDRYLLDRVATSILALDGRGGYERLAESAQWVVRAAPVSEVVPKPRPAVEGVRSRPAGPRKLSYLEQREWDGMEAAILTAEERLDQARRRSEDPAIRSDAAALEERLRALDEAQRAVDLLYARWAELER